MMGIDVCRHRVLMKICSPTVRPTTAQHGYTLVELLVGVTLGSVVLALLGGVLLVSEVKVAAKIQSNLDAKDSANRAIDLIRREAASSRYFRRSSRAYDPSSCSSSPIVLVHLNGAITCIKSVESTSTLLDAQYQKAFVGPCLLVRVGVPYKPNGELDTSAAPIVQPLLDGLALNGANCSSNRIGNGLHVTIATSGNNGFAGITINMDKGALFEFNAFLPSNPGYAGNDYFNNDNPCSSSSSYGCAGQKDRNVYHFKPVIDMASSFEEINGTESKENVFYFDYPSSEFNISEPCKYKACNVTHRLNGSAVKLVNVDAMVFLDREIRPPS